MEQGTAGHDGLRAAAGGAVSSGWAASHPEAGAPLGAPMPSPLSEEGATHTLSPSVSPPL